MISINSQLLTLDAPFSRRFARAQNECIHKLYDAHKLNYLEIFNFFLLVQHDDFDKGVGRSMRVSGSRERTDRT
jgi:hypothetical protein